LKRRKNVAKGVSLGTKLSGNFASGAGAADSLSTVRLNLGDIVLIRDVAEDDVREQSGESWGRPLSPLRGLTKGMS